MLNDFNRHHIYILELDEFSLVGLIFITVVLIKFVTAFDKLIMEVKFAR